MDKLCILYVDDEINNLNSFKAVFRRQYNVLVAETISKAMQLLDENEVAVLIVDHRMPEMTGVQFLEAVSRKHNDVVKMILTAVNNVQSILEAINTGRLFRYILKPWDADELKTAIDSALKLYELSKQNQILFTNAQEELVRYRRISSYLKNFLSSELVTSLLENESENSASYAESRVIACLSIEHGQLIDKLKKMDEHLAMEVMQNVLLTLGEVAKAQNGMILNFECNCTRLVFGALTSPTLSFADNAVQAAFALQDKLPAILSDAVACRFMVDMGNATIFNLMTPNDVRTTVLSDALNQLNKHSLPPEINNQVIYITQRTLDAIGESIQKGLWQSNAIPSQDGIFALSKTP